MHYLISHNFLNDLYDSGLPYAVIKGCPLELYKTGKADARFINDIDILVSRENAPEVVNLLKKRGFSIVDNLRREDYIMALTSSHQYPVYYKYVGEFFAQIDINYDIFWGEYTGQRIPVTHFLEDCKEINLWNCNIKTLSPMKMLIFVILHHYKEMNSIYHLMGHNAVKRRLFEDIYGLIINNPHVFTPEKVTYECEQYKIVPYAYYMFYYTNLVFNNALSQYENLLYTPQGKDLLNKYGLSEKEQKVWKIDFFDRFEMDKVISSIRADLSPFDIDKLERNRTTFGRKNENSPYWSDNKKHS